MKTYISKNLPKETTIFEKILLAKFESLYFKKDDDVFKKFTDKLSKAEFLAPLKEFKDIEFKLKHVQSSINSLLYKLKSDISTEAFYQIIFDLVFYQDQTLLALCRVILYWQMVLLSSSFSFEIDNFMRQIIDNNMENKNEMIMVFAHFLESSITFISFQDKNNFKIRNYDIEKSVDTLRLSYMKQDMHIFHFTRIPLPEKIYQQENFNHPLTEDDLVLKKLANSYGANEERKYDQGKVRNYEPPTKKDPYMNFLSTLTQFTKNYTNGLDLRTNFTFAVNSKIWKSDLSLAIKVLPVDAQIKTELENSLFDLVGGIEDIKTHLAFQPSARDYCDICGKKGGHFYSVECNWSKSFVPAFCRICVGMLLRSKFYMEINKPHLTLECFEKDVCMKRMIFTEDSLAKIFQNDNTLIKFLSNYKKLKDALGTCFSCYAKFTSTEIGDDVMCLKCKCGKKTCKICWEEVHFEKLCTHLQQEYNTVAVHDLVDRIIVCPFCYAVTRIPNAEEVAVNEGSKNGTTYANEGPRNGTTETNELDIESIKCDGCHRQLCKICFQSIDAINCHGPSIHSYSCRFYSAKRNKVSEGECDICEIKGYPCKEINYIKFLGF